MDKDCCKALQRTCFLVHQQRCSPRQPSSTPRTDCGIDPLRNAAQSSFVVLSPLRAAPQVVSTARDTSYAGRTSRSLSPPLSLPSAVRQPARSQLDNRVLLSNSPSPVPPDPHTLTSRSDPHPPHHPLPSLPHKPHDPYALPSLPPCELTRRAEPTRFHRYALPSPPAPTFAPDLRAKSTSGIVVGELPKLEGGRERERG